MLTLVEHLPPESALSTAYRVANPDLTVQTRPEDAPWASIDMLLALVVDELRMIGWAYAATHSEQKPAKPLPVPRPGVGRGRQRTVRQMTVAQMKQLDPRIRSLSDEDAVAKLEAMRGRGSA